MSAQYRHARWSFRVFGHPQPPQINSLNEALSLQPYGLRPTISLSTLNPRCYQRKLKTRYGMCWVSTFPVALSATSKQALRGAPEITKNLHFAPVSTVFDIHLFLLKPYEHYISRHLTRFSRLSGYSPFMVQEWCRSVVFLAQKRCKASIHAARNIGAKDGKPIHAKRYRLSPSS